MSDESLEKLKVVIEASANPFREEMKKLRKEMNDSSKVVDDQMKNIKADMDKTMEPIRKVQAQIRRIGETMKSVLGKSLPGNQFKDMSNSIEKTQKKLDKLIAAKHELEDSGKDMELTKSYRELESSAAKAEERLLKLKGNISALGSAGLDMEYTDDFKELMKVTDAAEKKLNSYIEQEDRMKATGTVNKKSNSWKNLQYNIEQARNTYNAYKMDMANATPSEKYQNTASWKKLQAEIEQTEKKLAEYKSEMESLSESEKVQPTDKWRKVQKEIYDTRIELAQMNEEQQKYEKSVRVSRVSKVFKNVLNTFKSLGQSIKKSGGLFASLIQKFRNGIPWFNKTRNSMHSIFGWVQGAFGQSIFHTGSKSDTSGSMIHQTVQNTFGAQSLSTSATVTTSGTDLRNSLQASFGGNPLTIGVSLVRNGWSSLTDWVNSFFGSGNSGRGASITRRADGGLFSGGVWHPVTAYAGGGSPASGQFFMAREAGPELVGTIGRHTAVMNNNQIVSSVSDGVYSAVLSAMSQTARSNSTPMELHVYVGGEKVTDYVIKDINGRTVSTGKCPILT